MAGKVWSKRRNAAASSRATTHPTTTKNQRALEDDRAAIVGVDISAWARRKGAAAGRQ